MIIQPDGFNVDPLGFSLAERLAGEILPEDLALINQELVDAGLEESSLEVKLDYLNTPLEYESEPEVKYATPDALQGLAGIAHRRAMQAQDSDTIAFGAQLVLNSTTVKKNVASNDPEFLQVFAGAKAYGLLSEADLPATFLLYPDGFVRFTTETPASHVTGKRVIVQASDL